MFEVQKTDEFDDWLSGLKDQKAKARLHPALNDSAVATPEMCGRSVPASAR